MPALTFTVHDDLPEPARRIVDDGLGDANIAAAPVQDVLPLSSFVHDEQGRVVGGAVGRTWGLCCELQQLWVDPAYRRQGVGARLVKEFEQRAYARGCRTFYLETFSFQAPSLYRSLGYEARLEIPGFAPGIVKYVMFREA